MHVFAIHIQNFRRFDSLTIHPSTQLNFIVGANNSGKTSLLRALDLALNPAHHPYRDDLVGRFDFWRCRNEKPIEIWVFFRFSTNDHPDLLQRFGKRVSRWRLMDPEHLVESSAEYLNTTGLPFEAATKDPFETVSPESGGTIELLATKFSAIWEQESGTIDLEWEVIDEVGENSLFSQPDRRAIGFTFIPSQREPLQMLGFSRRSLLGALLDDSEISGPLRNLVTEIEKLKDPLDKTESIAAALKSVSETLKELHLTDGVGEPEATITFLRTEINRLRSALELALRTVQPKEEESTQDKPEESKGTTHPFEVPLSYQGDGVQNSLLLATMAAGRAETVQAIGAIEEPERSLEPWRARALVKKIIGTSNHQLFITTHSPAVLAEVSPESLVVLTPKKRSDTEDSVYSVSAVVGRDIPQPARKEFERCREAYCRCLFSRLVLIVEGPSEIGFLPSALASAAIIRGGPDLSLLGLEIFENYESSRNMHLRGSNLGAFGKRTAVLIDHDEATDRNQTTEVRIKEAKTTGDVLVWSRRSILDGATGCDLEIILAKETPVAALAQSLKNIYIEAKDEHPINQAAWGRAKKPLRAGDLLASQVPAEFPNPESYDFASLDEPVARLTLLCLMHGPHSTKTARDMRRLAELLGTVLPSSILRLYDRLRDRLMTTREDSQYVCYDLHEGSDF
jgi:hypothetical protein